MNGTVRTRQPRGGSMIAVSLVTSWFTDVNISRGLVLQAVDNLILLMWRSVFVSADIWIASVCIYLLAAGSAVCVFDCLYNFTSCMQGYLRSSTTSTVLFKQRKLLRLTVCSSNTVHADSCSVIVGKRWKLSSGTRWGLIYKAWSVTNAEIMDPLDHALLAEHWWDLTRSNLRIQHSDPISSYSFRSIEQ